MNQMEGLGKLILLGAISQLPPEEKVKVEECAKEIRESISKHGDAGKFAVSLVMLEIET